MYNEKRYGLKTGWKCQPIGLQWTKSKSSYYSQAAAGPKTLTFFCDFRFELRKMSRYALTRPSFYSVKALITCIVILDKPCLGYVTLPLRVSYWRCLGLQAVDISFQEIFKGIKWYKSLLCTFKWMKKIFNSFLQRPTRKRQSSLWTNCLVSLTTAQIKEVYLG